MTKEAKKSDGTTLSRLLLTASGVPHPTIVDGRVQEPNTPLVTPKSAHMASGMPPARDAATALRLRDYRNHTYLRSQPAAVWRRNNSDIRPQLGWRPRAQGVHSRVRLLDARPSRTDSAHPCRGLNSAFDVATPAADRYPRNPRRRRNNGVTSVADEYDSAAAHRRRARSLRTGATTAYFATMAASNSSSRFTSAGDSTFSHWIVNLRAPPKSHFENKATSSPYDDDMFSLRVRLQCVFSKPISIVALMGPNCTVLALVRNSLRQAVASGIGE